MWNFTGEIILRMRKQSVADLLSWSRPVKYGRLSSCKFAEHDLIWKTAKWVLIELRASLIALTVHFQ